jgi:hypothetical protein
MSDPSLLQDLRDGVLTLTLNRPDVRNAFNEVVVSELSAWADAIAADMATVFEKSPGGYYDAKVGRRLREEIYAPGDSRNVTVSIERFLRRKQSIDPFLKTLGIGAK